MMRVGSDKAPYGAIKYSHMVKHLSQQELVPVYFPTAGPGSSRLVYGAKFLFLFKTGANFNKRTLPPFDIAHKASQIV
jgi:hypothetical protein